MKAFFCITIFASLFTACSTDGDGDLVFLSAAEPQPQHVSGESPSSNCISGLYGNVAIDVSNGLTDSRVVYFADITAASTAALGNSYTLHLEMQTLTDCENLTSGTGTISRFTLHGVAIPDVVNPFISLSRTQLPSSCYRWRWTMQGGTSLGPCTTTTQWYEEPLF